MEREWEKRNLTQVTPFPKEESDLDRITECIKEYEHELKDIVIHRQSDCFDFVPIGMDKSVGISYLLEKMNLTWDKVMVVGDGINDYGMFEKAGIRLGVKVKEEERVDYNFDSTEKMLSYLLTFI